MRWRGREYLRIETANGVYLHDGEALVCNGKTVPFSSLADVFRRGGAAREDTADPAPEPSRDRAVPEGPAQDVTVPEPPAPDIRDGQAPSSAEPTPDREEDPDPGPGW